MSALVSTTILLSAAPIARGGPRALGDTVGHFLAHLLGIYSHQRNVAGIDLENSSALESARCSRPSYSRDRDRSGREWQQISSRSSPPRARCSTKRARPCPSMSPP